MSQSWLIAKRYEVGKTLGQGGMGVVYQGRDRQSGEVIAIKALRPDALAGDPNILKRFRRESEALRQLNHPSIVKILDEVEENGRHYIIMEYVSGGSLSDRMHDNNMLPIPQVLELSLDLADALTRAHRLRIIHRDLKPQNILLAQDGTPRLTDFGVAQMQDHQRVTQTGMIIGTIAYLSPEACEGKAVDERLDIWAFGILLYEMLSGKRPFDESTTVATLSAILRKPLPPVRELRSDVPVGLARLIERMLQKDPNDRLPSVRMVGAEIEVLIRNLDESMLDQSVVLRKTASVLSTGESRFVTPTDESAVEEFELDFAGQPPANPPAAAPPAVASPAAVVPASPRSVRRDDDPPRLFVSYRREDSEFIAGKLAHQLGVAFGTMNILKDIDRLSLRTVSRLVLAKDTVGASDALIVVIGKKWRVGLDNPKDPVRQEIEIGLRKKSMVVQPVLVNGATMPSADQLPPSLQVLTTYNPIKVSKKQFEPDARKLIERLQRALGVKTGLRFPMPLLYILAAVLVALLAAFVIVAINASDTSLREEDVLRVSPVRSDEMMVLIAELDADQSGSDSTTQVIISDLTQAMREADPFSKLRLRRYEAVIESDADAQLIARVNDAPVIIWGGRDESAGYLVHVQVGDATALPYNNFAADRLGSTFNLDARVNNPRADSLILPVMSVVTGLETADGDGYNVLRNLLIFGNADIQSADVLSKDSVAALVYRFLTTYTANETEALAAINRALEADSSNAVLLAYRALMLLRVGQADRAAADALQARDTGPEGWTSPLYLRANSSLMSGNVEGALTEYTRIVALRPDDWFPLMYRGVLQYAVRNYDAAWADLWAVTQAQPDANFPYGYLSLIALHDKRIDDARTMRGSIRPGFTDPVFGAFIPSMSGDDSDVLIFSALFGSYAALMEGEYATVIEQAAIGNELAPGLTDFYLLRGMAACSLGNHEEAEAVYTSGLERDDEFTVMYLLRGQSRRELGRPARAEADFLHGRGRTVTREVRLLTRQMEVGVIDCTNLFDPPAEADAIELDDDDLLQAGEDDTAAQGDSGASEPTATPSMTITPTPQPTATATHQPQQQPPPPPPPGSDGNRPPPPPGQDGNRPPPPPPR
jgi:serine/threonine protein kinase/tetratricopeptide (TPR) repeat protein